MARLQITGGDATPFTRAEHEATHVAGSQQLRLGATLTNIGVVPQIIAQFEPFEAGFLNVEDRRMTMSGTIAFSTGALETPVITLAFEIDDGADVLGLISISSLAVAGSNNDSPIRFEFTIVCDTPGSSAAFIGTGDMLVTSALVTTARNMLPDWLSTNQIDVTGVVTARLTIAASSNMASAHLVEAFLRIE